MTLHESYRQSKSKRSYSEWLEIMRNRFAKMAPSKEDRVKREITFAEFAERAISV